LNIFKNKQILESVKGVIVGKPVDEVYYEEYKSIYLKVCYNLKTHVLYNVNFGHSAPRCILQYDSKCTIDLNNKKIFVEK
jgi:muramoyltetrapeptide carboxypeptidase LdcA involved in peptidoglycan recycling